MSRRWLWFGAAALAVVAFPWLVNTYTVHMMVISFIYLILVDGLNLIYGYTGQLSLGHAAFYGLGAYTAAILSTRFGVGLWPAMAAAMVVAAAGGAVLGVPALRLRGSYLIIATLCFNFIVTQVLMNWVELTNGPLGLRNVGVPSLSLWPGLTLTFATKRSYYYLVAVLALVAHGLVGRLVNSRTGRALKAIREDPTAALALGVNVAYYKIVAFLISSALAGAAGALYCFYVRFVSPEGFSVVESTEFLVMLVMGGAGQSLGPIAGVFTAHFLLEQLRILGSWRLSIYGILLFVIVRFSPRGLVGLAEDLWARRTSRRGSLPPGGARAARERREPV